MSIEEIPLSKLSPSKANVRKTGGQNIADLAASIQAHGLLQNLTVTAKGGKFEVVAGGRRHRALQSLVKSKAIDADFPVPCQIVLHEDAGQVSLAENIVREAMHPADQFDAFQALSDKGHGVAAISGAFGVSEAVVKQRLKLARVSPKLIADYREGKMDLDMLQAFTLSDDRKEQERIWNELSGNSYGRNAHNVRSQITQKEVALSRSKAAKFIGVESYESAGGAVRRDMFSDEIYFLDSALLERLMTDHLERVADGVRAEGWLWVKVATEGANTWEYSKRRPKNRPTTVDEDRELAAIVQERDGLQAQLDAWQQDDSESIEIDDEAIEDQIEMLTSRENTLRGSLANWSAKILKEAGAIVELTYNGAIEIHRGLVRAADEKKAAAAKQAKAAGLPEPTGPTISEAMVERLTAHRTAAIQQLLTERQQPMLAVLAHALASDTFHFQGEKLGEYSARFHSPEVHGVDPAFPAFLQVSAARGEWSKRIPETDLFAWCLDQSHDDLLDLIGVCVASAFNGTINKGSGRYAQVKTEAVDQLASRLELHMSDYWQPTAALYFDHVPKGLAIDAVTEALGADVAKELAPMKKAAAAERAEELLDESDWLPHPLRRLDI